MTSPDAAREAQIRGTVLYLEGTPEDQHPSILEKATHQNGGQWNAPSAAGRKPARQRLIYSMTLFGVSAKAYTFADLPKNWMKAAKKEGERLRNTADA